MLPFRRTTARRGILKDDSWKHISSTSPCQGFLFLFGIFFFLLNYEEFMIAI